MGNKKKIEKINLLIFERGEGFEERTVEIAFKKLNDAKKYLKNMIIEGLMESQIYKKGINDENFKSDYEDEERKYSLKEIELR